MNGETASVAGIHRIVLGEEEVVGDTLLWNTYRRNDRQ